MENILKIGDKVKGFEYAGVYGYTRYYPEYMEQYNGVTGTVTEISPKFNEDIVNIDFGDDSYWYPKEEALAHKVEIPERVYTEPTSLLKEIWRLYGGKKSGNPESAYFFCNTDQHDELGNFEATICQESYFTCGDWGEYQKVNEQEFIRLMEFEQELIDKAEDNLESNRILENAKKSQQFQDEVNNFKQITDSIADLLQYKNNKYGNSALEPLEIFGNKCKVGTRLDDKLSRIKNSTELKKNDIADCIGYLILVCKENGWDSFDEFKD